MNKKIFLMLVVVCLTFFFATGAMHRFDPSVAKMEATYSKLRFLAVDALSLNLPQNSRLIPFELLSSNAENLLLSEPLPKMLPINAKNLILDFCSPYRIALSAQGECIASTKGDSVGQHIVLKVNRDGAVVWKGVMSSLELQKFLVEELFHKEDGSDRD